MGGLRLFLPESWTDDPERMARARAPEDRRTALTKPEIAIEEIDRVIASGGKAPQVQHPGSTPGRCRSAVGWREMAKGQLAARH